MLLAKKHNIIFDKKKNTIEEVQRITNFLNNNYKWLVGKFYKSILFFLGFIPLLVIGLHIVRILLYMLVTNLKSNSNSTIL